MQIVAYESVLNSQKLYGQQLIDDITFKHQQGVFSIDAVGGYETSTFVLKGSRDYLDDWYQDGILRRIVWYNPEGIQVWEGYVHKMRYVFGDTAKTKSLEGYYNRVYLKYAPLDTSVSPPVAGDPVTLQFDNVEQQAIYGVKSAVISGGERADSTAFAWGRTVLNERSKIPEGDSINTLAADEASIEIECRGYFETMKWIPYESSATGTDSADAVIQDIITFFDAINAGWISTDYGLMDYNYQTEGQGYDSLLSCAEVIKNIITMGGAGGERWVGGVYQNGQFIYKPAEDFEGLYGDEAHYFRSLNDPSKKIFDQSTGGEVKPWDIVPDRIIQTNDMSLGLNDLMYIERMTFREPYGIQLTGGDDDRLNVFLAQRGLPQL